MNPHRYVVIDLARLGGRSPHKSRVIIAVDVTMTATGAFHTKGVREPEGTWIDRLCLDDSRMCYHAKKTVLIVCVWKHGAPCYVSFTYQGSDMFLAHA